MASGWNNASSLYISKLTRGQLSGHAKKAHRFGEDSHGDETWNHPLFELPGMHFWPIGPVLDGCAQEMESAGLVGHQARWIQALQAQVCRESIGRLANLLPPLGVRPALSLTRTHGL